jgi:hypothetical protein
MQYLSAEQQQEGVDASKRPGAAVHRKLLEQVIIQLLLRSAGRAADGKSGFRLPTAH